MIYFITGGSRGIGAAIVLEAVRAGHDVAFTYRSRAAEAEAVIAGAKELDPTRRVLAYALDVGDPEQVESVGDRVLEDFDTVHVVVNNAGINSNNLASLMSNGEWDEVLRTNLSGPFYVCRHFLTSLLANRFGRIINISSLAAFGASGQANYAAAKAGLHGLTQTLAKEYGRKGVTANALVLGLVDTEMTQATMSDGVHDYWKKNCPWPKGKLAEPRDVANVVVFLGSEGSRFVNGQVINLSGGLDWGP